MEKTENVIKSRIVSSPAILCAPPFSLGGDKCPSCHPPTGHLRLHQTQHSRVAPRNWLQEICQERGGGSRCVHWNQTQQSCGDQRNKKCPIQIRQFGKCVPMCLSPLSKNYSQCVYRNNLLKLGNCKMIHWNSFPVPLFRSSDVDAVWLCGLSPSSPGERYICKYFWDFR